MNRAKLKKIGFGGEAGQSLVETAITVPVLAIVLLGCGEMARLAYASIEVTNAAKAAAQYGAQSTGTAADTPGIQLAASNETTDVVSNLTTTPHVKVVCSDGTVPADSAGPTWANTDCSTSYIEQILTVTTSGTFSPLITVPGLPKSYTLNGYAVQRVLAY
jgi:Flp pilus assembly protein TadG